MSNQLAQAATVLATKTLCLVGCELTRKHQMGAMSMPAQLDQALVRQEKLCGSMLFRACGR